MEITLKRAEGRIEECVEAVYASWEAAEHCIKRWARTAPERGDGYHKVDVVLGLDADTSIGFRFDMTRGDVSAYRPLFVAARSHCAHYRVPRRYVPEEARAVYERAADMLAAEVSP